MIFSRLKSLVKVLPDRTLLKIISILSHEYFPELSLDDNYPINLC